MEFKICKTDFLTALNATQGVVEKKNVMPILANILLDAGEKGLSISATDLEVAIVVSVAAQVKTPGKIIVLAKSIYEIIREAASEDIHIKASDNDRIEITAGNSRYKILALAAKEFPKLPDVDGRFFTVTTKDFMAALDKVGFAMSADEARYHLNGILLEKQSSGETAVIATDGHRLSFTQAKLGWDFKQNKLILPRQGVGELRKLVGETQGFELAASDRHVFVKLPDKTLTIRLVDGEFPDYTRVIPKDNPVSITLPREELVGVLRRVSLLASDRSKGVGLYFCNNSLTVTSSNPEVGEAKEEIALSYKGPVINIGFNARYFLDVLGVIDDTEVKVAFKDELSPCLVTCPSDERFRSVIMPMRM
jgi:DNA polymerase-3 subunit beta